MEGTVVDPSERIWYLRCAGLSFVEIAAQLQMDPSAVIRRFREYQLYLAKDVSLEKREQQAHMVMSQLDALQYPFYEQAMTGDVKSAEFVLKVIQTRMKLFNLDAANPNTESGQQQILIVGNSKEEFLSALQHGRNQLASSPSDDEEDEEDEE